MIDDIFITNLLQVVQSLYCGDTPDETPPSLVYGLSRREGGVEARGSSVSVETYQGGSPRSAFHVYPTQRFGDGDSFSSQIEFASQQSEN